MPNKCVRNTWVSVSTWQLCTGYTAKHLSWHAVFHDVVKREIIRQSVLICLKIWIITYLFIFLTMLTQTVHFCFTLFVYFFCPKQKWRMYFSSFNGLYLKYHIKLFTIGLLLNFHPWCRMCATKCLQWTMPLYTTNCLSHFL